jgi:DNA-binding response OmpR family regulator
MQNPPPKAHSDSAQRRSVVVVEDDAAIAMGLRINLEKEGYDVRVATNGEAGLETIRGGKPDLVILDIMLPNMNGFEVLQTLRREGFGMPVIVLSARTGEIDKVTGLELGAEDYVAKPFSLAELLARVRAALRRGHAIAPPQTFGFSDVIIDIAAREVRKNGSVVEMTATEFDVLMCLVEARGKALTREHIFHKVWGPKHHGTPRTIDNFIQQLRAKLEPNPQEPKHFHTVRGVGYRFDA